MKYTPLYWTGRFLAHQFSHWLLRIKVADADRVPSEGGVIIASNHISVFDPPVLGSWIDRPVYFFAKDTLFEIPVLGRIIRRTNAIPVRRGTIDRDALDRAVEIVRRGDALVVFPEGTRSKTDQFLNPKAGVGMIAHRAECPIVPACIQGLNQIKKSLVFRTRPAIAFGEPFSAEWVKSFPAERESYHEMARTVMARIGELRDRIRDVKAS